MQLTPETNTSTPATPQEGPVDLQQDIAYPILGKLAIDSGLLTKEQLRQAISEMLAEKSMGKTVSLEEILISRGYIRPASMEKLLASTLRAMDRQFCTLAQEVGILDSAVCEMALSMQADAYREGRLVPVSEILMEKQMLSPEQQAHLLSRMRGQKAPAPQKPKPSLLEAWKEQDKKREITASSKKIPAEEMAIARMALQYNFITTEQLQTAIQHWSQAQQSLAPRNLSQILEDLGLINRKQISLLHAARLFHETRQMDQMFGRLCIRNNFCTEDDVLRALDTQLAKFKRNRTIKLLGNILMEMDVLTHEQMLYVLREQKRVPDQKKKEAEPHVQQPTMPLKDPGVFVEIEEDGLSARLMPAPLVSPDLSLADLLQLIKAAGVVFGLVPKKTFERYLTDPEAQQAPFEIAQGIPPKDPEDGYIRYGFDPDYLKVGSVDPDGNIDYFNRGEVPFIRARTLLAERIPPKEGAPGMKVTGEEALPKEPRDVELRAGSGAELSLDGQMVHALIDGQPHTTLGGKISVFPEMNIQGDVDLKTGHVSFAGAIRIQGSVQPGFRVEAASASVTAVTDADITVTGDLVVKDGVIGARIRAGGMVQAKFVVDSEILAFGNIVVEKEIINSVIRTSSTLALPGGKLIASEAAARGGMEIYEVGTDKSAPCRLFIGVDFHIQSESQRLRQESARLKKEIETTQKSIQNLENQQIELHKAIAKKAQLQDHNLRLITKLSAALTQNNPKAAAITNHIAHLKAENQAAETAITELFAEQDKILDHILGEQTKMETLSKAVEETRSEYQALMDWNKIHTPKPMLRLKGPMASGTLITATKSQISIKEKVRNMVFTEVQTTDYEGEPSWAIRMQNK